MDARMLQRHDRGNVAVVTMCHRRANALDVELSTALVDAFDELEASTVGAVVLIGAGDIFSAGADLFRVVDATAVEVESFLQALSRTLTRVFMFPRPVVAAINGHAIAGGAILACACDYRVAAVGPSTIGVPELRVGVPFPAVALEIVRASVSPQHLHDLIYTGRLCDPEQARHVGLIDEVVASDVLLERACALAAEFATYPAASFAVTKRMLREPAMERAALSAESLGRVVVETWNHPDARAAIRRFVERTLVRRPGV